MIKHSPQLTEKQVKITSQRHDYSIKITLNSETYLIDSEDLGIQNPHIIIRAYQKGTIIYSHKISYSDILNEPNFHEKLSDLLKQQQQVAIEAIRLGKPAPEITQNQNKLDMEEKERIVTQKRTCKGYIKEVAALVRKKLKHESFELLGEALEHYPNNPTLLSYQGYLNALVNRKYAEGINVCRQSIKILRDQMSLVEGFFLPVLYLNLGRTYLIANKKKDAYFAFQNGLEIDKKNEDLMKEIRKLGLRRKPFFPFLKRSNPLNKYTGMLTYKEQKKLHR